MKYIDELGSINSVYPPTDYLTNGPWIYMVPQFKPKSVLMLGYAGGTTAGLIRLLYGDVPITAVDIEPCEDRYGVNLIQADAKEFVKTCKQFEVVIVDLLCGKYDAYEFILGKEFVDNLKRIGNYFIVNTIGEPDMKEYTRAFIRYGKNKPNRLSNLIFYFGTKEYDVILR